MKKYAAAAAAGILFIISGFSASALNTSVTISGWPGSFWQCPDSDQTLTPGATGVRITTDPDIVQEGSGALHIFVEKTADNLNAQAVQSVSGMEAGKSYRITGLFNVPSTSSRYRLALGNTTLIVLGQAVTPLTWERLDYVFEYDGSSTEFKIQASGGGNIYADDLSLREVIYEDDGITVAGYGEELLQNGNFEDDLDFTPPGEIEDHTVLNMDSQAEISWTNPTNADFEKVRLYDITDGDKVYIGETSEDHYLVTGLENNVTHQILIQTIDDWGNVSDGIVVEVTPIPDAFKITEPVFYLNGEETEQLASGILNVQLSAKNNSMPEDYSVELILVLLQNDAVIDVRSEYYIIPCTDFKEPYTDMSVEITVPDGDGYRAELYVWNSLTGMDALTDPAGIE